MKRLFIISLVIPLFLSSCNERTVICSSSIISESRVLPATVNNQFQSGIIANFQECFVDNTTQKVESVGLENINIRFSVSDTIPNSRHNLSELLIKFYDESQSTITDISLPDLTAVSDTTFVVEIPEGKLAELKEFATTLKSSIEFFGEINQNEATIQLDILWNASIEVSSIED